MKAKIVVIILSIVLTLFVVTTAIFGILYLKSPHCNTGKPFDEQDKSTWLDKTPNIFTLPTEKDIAQIEEGMHLEDVVSILGKAQADIGSGFHILRWTTRNGDFYLRVDVIGKGEGEYEYVVKFMPDKFNKK